MNNDRRKYRYTYGPVPSRRLGRSLGVDPIPQKTCNFSCIYCQLGRTTNFINERRDFFPREEIAKEIDRRVEENPDIDYITFVGDGEPTLCKSLGWLIERSKKHSIPVAVITNGALLYDMDVREELSKADLVLPSLDAGCEETFKLINRPRMEIIFDKMVEGMVKFRKIYHGQIWMEYMAIEDLNDGMDELRKIGDILKRISPDKIYVNVPIRPPAESWVKPSTKIEDINSIFGEVSRIVLPEEGDFYVSGADERSIRAEVHEIIKRHPMRREQLYEILKEKKIPDSLVQKLIDEGKIKRIMYNGEEFYIDGRAKRVER